jgi:signal transduction histidine kinase
LLSQPLVELVAEEQRPAAGRWLEQVLKGAEPPGAEWDFMNASGERVKLELNTRMIELNGKPLEVEVIGRDITERRHMENQILEISNKEQQRIGHDLHDGVCQQLAAIAYRTHILARRLQSKDAAESAEAEGIGDSINESLVQTRGVARGLFPVRLEENGLVSALEELSANISSLFKVNCSFVSTTPTAAVEYNVALHVHYIAQEAAMNAARHSKAEKITIRLAEEQGRLVLSVEDDGSGFAPAHNPHNAGGGMGIAIMRYRARVIGATLDLNTKAGQGTRVTCGFQVSAQKSYAHQ